MHDRPLIHLDDGFWLWWAVAQGTVGAFGIVVFPPFFGQDLSLVQTVKDFTGQGLIPEPCMKAITISVLPR